MTGATSASIIVNNLNYEAFLREAIDSALRQTRPALEVIVVDDGSTDGSREIISAYGQQVKAVFKENGGQGSAFNAGFRESRGDVIFFLDADDLLAPTAVEAVVPRFESGGFVKVHWPLQLIDAAGRPTGAVLPDAELLEGDFREVLIHEGPDSYQSTPTSGNAWSRRVLERVLPVPENEYRQGADGYLLTVTPLHGPIGRLSEPQSFYRVHGRNQFWTAALDERVGRSLQRYEIRARTLLQHLSAQGINCDPEAWKRRSAYYQWMQEVCATADELRAVVPRGSVYVLVDGGHFGGQLVGGRRAVPFVERDGVDWGPPPDDDAALRELRRAIEAHGARFVAFARPAFWWLEHYRSLQSHLSDYCRRVWESGRVIVYDLELRR